MADRNVNSKKSTEKTISTSPTGNFIFGKDNYILMIVGVVIIIIGFTLMSGKENILNDSIKVTVAPILILIGFVVEIFAIMKPKKD